MCQGDTALITMMFADYSLRPIGNFTSPHECVNWPRLMEWVEPNSRDLAQEGWLVHPKFGEALPPPFSLPKIFVPCPACHTQAVSSSFASNPG